MREIKFRIWHKKESRWLDPWAEEDPILSLKDYGKGCEVFLYDRKSKEHSNINCQMDDVVIQQYTGLKDKNGVEIYEGDIITSRGNFITDEIDEEGNYPDVLAVVVWSDKHSGLKLVMYKNYEKWLNGSDNLKHYNCLACHVDCFKEVVGNIFEGVDK